MQAIFTKYYGPTNTRSARVVAWCDAGRVSIPYSYEGGEHYDAARALRDKLGWTVEAGYPPMYCGGAPHGMRAVHNVFVFADEQERLPFAAGYR